LKGVRASPAVHWKMACTPVVDEAIHQSGVKVGVGTPYCCRIMGFQETWEIKKRLLLVGCFEFAAHTLPPTYWLVALIGPSVSFT